MSAHPIVTSQLKIKLLKAWSCIWICQTGYVSLFSELSPLLPCHFQRVGDIIRLANEISHSRDITFSEFFLASPLASNAIALLPLLSSLCFLLC